MIGHRPGKRLPLHRAYSLLCAGVAALLLAAPVMALTHTWNGTTGDWFDAAKWTNGVPVDGADAVILSGSVTLTNTTADLGSFTMAGGTLTFTNWYTKLTATNVVITNGTVTLPAAYGVADMSNRVWIVCNNFFLGSGRTINANGAGYKAIASSAGQGPGASNQARAGAGHGGFGGNYITGGLPHDSTNAPIDPGSSGGSFGGALGGNGGGAILIDATGSVMINGTLTANASAAGANTGGGSGGAILINCSVFGGTNGMVSANGSAANGGGPGGGGRIAVNFNPTAQSNAPAHSVTFSAREGGAAVFLTDYISDMGTVYFPTPQLLDTNLPHSGSIVIPGFTSWNVDSLRVTGHIRFAGDGMAIYATNDIAISGSGAGLDIGGNAFFSSGVKREGVYRNYVVDSRMTARPSLTAGGNLTLTNGGSLCLYCPITNSPTPDYGIRVAVTGDIVVSSGSVIYPVSSPTNGASPVFECRNFTVLAGGQVNADGLGFTSSGSTGYGPAPGGTRAGGGYGGFGGNFGAVGGRPYGSLSAPVHPGSAGGPEGTTPSGGAGGLVRVAAASNITVNGTISANGATAGGNGGSGSGGGVNLSCNTFAANGGLIRANGGVLSGTGGGGGGGRIAIVYNSAAQASAPAVNVTLSAQPNSLAVSYPGGLGTIYFPDNQLLPADITKLSGQLPAVTSWAPDHLTVSNCWVRFTADGVQISVTNSIRVDGTSGRLEIGGSTLLLNGSYRDVTSSFMLSSEDDPALTCGDLLVTNGASLYVYSAPTNVSGRDYGALVTVTGNVTVATNSWVYPVSHPTNAGSARFTMQNLSVSAGAGFSAYAYGAAGGPTRSGLDNGFGRGGGASRCGGSYGGGGGYYQVSSTYGDSNAPVEAGSGGGSWGFSNPGRPGGGMIWIDVTNSVALDGTLTASAEVSAMGNVGAGSGGGIWVRCTRFSGGAAGRLRADGGGNTSGGGGGGGGGRIAVWRAYHTFAGMASATGGVGAVAPFSAQPGSVVWMDMGPAITNVGATNIMATTADLVADLTATGRAPVEVRCFWGLTNEGENSSAWMTNDYLGWLTPGRITNSVTGLTPGTQYYFSFHATNLYGDDWGTPAVNFSSVGGAVVNNGAGASNVAPTSATLWGDVVSGFPTPDAYVCWGTSDPAMDSTSAWEHVVSAGPRLGPFSVDITNLLANQTLFYRCYVSNDNGPGWAATVAAFTTAPPTIAIGDASVTEGAPSSTTPAVFPVTLSATSAVDVSVAFASANGSAHEPEDYTATGGVLVLPALTVNGSVTVTVLGDSTDEFPSENFFVSLSSPSGVVLGRSTGEGTILDDDDTGETKVWNGTGSWTSATNWSPSGEPSASDAVTIQSGTVVLGKAVTLASLVVSNGATLVMSNWSTRVEAADVLVRNTGTITLPAAFTDTQMSNRVWIACTNLTVAAGGLIDADARGYAAAGGPAYGYGPGHPTGARGAAGYGGSGGNFAWYNGWTYGSAEAPLAPGSGADGSAGGGAIRVEATGTVTVDGTITAKGGDTPGSLIGCGSGGSLYLTCRTFAGSTGLLRATGGDSVGNNGGGGGGRIAVAYDPAAQAAAPLPAVRLSVLGGDAPSYDGEPGTIHLPDSRLLSSTVSNINGVVLGFNAWTTTSLTVDGCMLQLAADGFALDVSGDLTVRGSGGSLLLGGNAVLPFASFAPYGRYLRFSAGATPLSLTVGGDVVVSNGGSLHVYAAPTNVAATHGATVTVTGDLRVETSSWVYAISHPTNGASVLWQVRQLRVAAGAGVSAQERGWAGGAGATAWGPGKGGDRCGGGYGGPGGYVPSPGGQYGNSNAPVHPGSGGGRFGASQGGSGGGLIRMEATGNAIIDGTLTAAGGQAGENSGGGSGGGILLQCRALTGTGALLAFGGSSSSGGGGGGGGGRIAVWYGRISQQDKDLILNGQEDQVRRFESAGSYEKFTGTATVAGGEAGTYDGTAGTVVFVTVLPVPGTVFSVR